MLHHSEAASLVLHNDDPLLPSSSLVAGTDEPAPTEAQCCGGSPRGSLAERAVAASTGELSWGSQAALAPWLGADEGGPGGGGKAAAGGGEAGVSSLSLQGDSSSDTLGEEEEDEVEAALAAAEMEGSPAMASDGERAGKGGELREVATAGGYAYAPRLARSNSAGSSQFEKVLRQPSRSNILPNTDLLQVSRGG